MNTPGSADSKKVLTMSKTLANAVRVLAVAILMLVFDARVAMADNHGPITVATWNVESGGADTATIAGQIAAFDGVDIWGLTEVNGDGDALLYENGAEVGEAADFARVVGTTGGADRMVVLYDDSRFDLQGSGELSEINIGGSVRASLVVTLTETASAQSLIFMVNHLYRSNEDARHQQAQLLNAWAAAQTLPVINVGDFNFDFAVDESSRDLGYDNLVANGVWQWVRPATLVTTQCSGWPCAFNSVLDFVFVSGDAQSWQGTSTITVRAGDFPDDATTSDHRPVLATLTPGNSQQRLFLPVALRGGVGQPGVADVRIAEIVYDPPGSDADGERVLIRNAGSAPADMTGWRLSDEAGTTFIFPPFTLGAGDSVNVWVGSGVDTGSDLYWGRSSATWNNNGDIATLRNAAAGIVHTCAYTGGDEATICP
jgi:endonuclease/exonuclease/phosphatase family metal-dependent hydrolase